MELKAIVRDSGNNELANLKRKIFHNSLGVYTFFITPRVLAV